MMNITYCQKSYRSGSTYSVVELNGLFYLTFFHDNGRVSSSVRDVCPITIKT